MSVSFEPQPVRRARPPQPSEHEAGPAWLPHAAPEEEAHPPILRQSAAPTAPASPAPGAQAVSSTDPAVIDHAMAVLGSLRPSPVASGLFEATEGGKTIQIPGSAAEEMKQQAAYGIRQGLRKIERRTEMARLRYEAQQEVNQSQGIVASVSSWFSWQRDAGPEMKAIEGVLAQHEAQIRACLERGDLASALRLYMGAAAEAGQLAQVSLGYGEGLIEGAQLGKEFLTDVKDTSVTALSVLALFASAGGSALPGALVNAGRLARVIAVGAPMAMSAAQAASTAATGQKVDWGDVIFEVALQGGLAYVGGKVQLGPLKKLLEQPATAGLRAVLMRAATHGVNNVIGQEISTLLSIAAQHEYAMARGGRPPTLEELLHKVAQQGLDPKALAMSLAMGLFGATADYNRAARASTAQQRVGAAEQAAHEAERKAAETPATEAEQHTEAQLREALGEQQDVEIVRTGTPEARARVEAAEAAGQRVSHEPVEGRGVRVYGHDGAVWMEVGPEAAPTDIRQHVPAAQAFQAKASRLRQAMGRAGEFLGLMPKDTGSALYREHLEVRKHQEIVEQRQGALERLPEGPARAQAEAELAGLRARLAHHEAAFAGDIASEGFSFVAAGRPTVKRHEGPRTPTDEINFDAWGIRLKADGVKGDIDAIIARAKVGGADAQAAAGELRSFERAQIRGHQVEVLTPPAGPGAHQGQKTPEAKLEHGAAQFALETKTATEPPAQGTVNKHVDKAYKQIKASNLLGQISLDWTGVELRYSADFKTATDVERYVNGKMTNGQLRQVQYFEIVWKDGSGETWVTSRARGADGAVGSVTTELL
jgi:hypothetical protein